MQKPFEELTKLVHKASKKEAPRLPSLLRVTLRDSKAVEGERTHCSTQVEQIRENVGILAEVLRDPERARYQAGEVAAAQKTMVDFVRGYPDEGNRRHMALGYISAMLEMYPPTSGTLNAIADVGMALEVFAEEPNDDRQAVRLPVTVVTEGRSAWRGKRLRVVIQGSKGLIKALQQFSERVETARENLEKDRTRSLYEGAGNFLDVLEKGSGEAAFFAPDNRENGRLYPGGHVRVSVASGQISARSAEGGCFRKIQEIAEAGIEIPVDAITQDRIQLKNRVEQNEFYLVLTFHSILHRGYLAAMRKRDLEKASEARKARVTVSTESFVMDRACGIALFFFKSWRVREKDGGVEERELRNLEFLVERNTAGELAVVDCQKWAKEIFAPCREFCRPEELSQPLSAMMKRLHTLFTRKREDGAVSVDEKPTETNQELREELLGGDNKAEEDTASKA